MKVGGKAHAALAQFASEHSGETFTAVQIKAAIAETGYLGPMSGLIPGDHAVKPDGSPANEASGCNCSRILNNALFIRIERVDGKWLFSPSQHCDKRVKAPPLS